MSLGSKKLNDVALLLVPAEMGGFETAIAKGDHKTGVIQGQTGVIQGQTGVIQGKTSVIQGQNQHFGQKSD